MRRLQSGPISKTRGRIKIVSHAAHSPNRREYEALGLSTGSALGPVATERAAAKETRVAAPTSI